MSIIPRFGAGEGKVVSRIPSGPGEARGRDGASANNQGSKGSAYHLTDRKPSFEVIESYVHCQCDEKIALTICRAGSTLSEFR
jgi:hypothetical protein